MSDEVPRNILMFNRVVVLVLARLYEEFPVPVSLDAGQIGTAACEGFTEDQEEIFLVLFSVAGETIRFLRDESLIQFEEQGGLSGDLFGSVRLTMRGLALLGRVPEGVDAGAKGKTLGAQIRAAGNKGAADYVASLVGQVVGASVGAGWRALSGGL